MLTIKANPVLGAQLKMGKRPSEEKKTIIVINVTSFLMNIIYICVSFMFL